MTHLEDESRRLLWHGVLLFLLSLLIGGFVPRYTTPRLGLSAHTGGLMAALFMALVGMLWSRLDLTPSRRRAAFWLTLYGNYVSTLALFLAAVFGTSRSTPLHGAGHSGTAWQEALVDVTLATSAVAVLLLCVLLLWGLRRHN